MVCNTLFQTIVTTHAVVVDKYSLAYLLLDKKVYKFYMLTHEILIK